MRPADEKLMITPGLPECMKGSAMQGDPAHGAYVIYAKTSADCEVPTHWHTAGGELFWISGTRQFKMKDIGEQTVKAGMFVRVPSKHQHSERCVTSCSFYAVGDKLSTFIYRCKWERTPIRTGGALRKPIAAKKKQ